MQHAMRGMWLETMRVQDAEHEKLVIGRSRILAHLRSYNLTPDSDEPVFAPSSRLASPVWRLPVLGSMQVIQSQHI